MDIKDKEQVFEDWIARMRGRISTLCDLQEEVEGYSIDDLDSTKLKLDLFHRIWKLEDEIASAESSLQSIRDMRDVIESLSTMGDPKDQPS